MIEVLEFIFSGFWVWLGSFFILAIPFNFINGIIRIYIRRKNIRDHGWPPSHLDADGSFKQGSNGKENIISMKD